MTVHASPQPLRGAVALRSTHARRPYLVWTVVVSTAIASAGLPSVFGVRVAGLAWLVPMLVALGTLALVRGRISFPWLLWLPWSLLVAGYVLFAEAENSLQRSVMLLCPVIVGVAVSRLRVAERELEAFRRAYRALAVALWAAVVVNTGILATGDLPESTGLAAPVMTSALLCTVFAATYALGRKRDLRWWGALALIPIVAVTRMGILATGLTFPLTFAPLRLKARLLVLGAMLAAGLALFQTERIQRKMFMSGSGTLEEIARDNPDFAMNGRRGIWDAMEAEIAYEPWFGHGANASEPFVSALTNGLTHPHNDWLRLAYDYGYVGTGLFALTLLAQGIHLLLTARRAPAASRSLFYAGGSSVFVLVPLFMLTDNIVLYAAFFGNLQFTILGLAYAANATARAARR